MLDSIIANVIHYINRCNFFLKNIFLSIHPDEPNAYDSMGDLLVKMGDTEGAKEMYNKAAEMHPDFAEVSAAKAAKL